MLSPTVAPNAIAETAGCRRSTRGRDVLAKDTDLEIRVAEYYPIGRAEAILPKLTPAENLERVGRFAIATTGRNHRPVQRKAPLIQERSDAPRTKSTRHEISENSTTANSWKQVSRPPRAGAP